MEWTNGHAPTAVCLRCATAVCLRCATAVCLRCATAVCLRCATAVCLRCATAVCLRCATAVCLRCATAVCLRCATAVCLRCATAVCLRCTTAVCLRCATAVCLRCGSFGRDGTPYHTRRRPIHHRQHTSSLHQVGICTIQVQLSIVQTREALLGTGSLSEWLRKKKGLVARTRGMTTYVCFAVLLYTKGCRQIAAPPKPESSPHPKHTTAIFPIDHNRLKPGMYMLYSLN